MLFALRQFRFVVANALRVTLADPFFIVLHLCMLALMVLLAALPGYTYDDNLQLLREQTGALLFAAACLTAIFGLIRVVTLDMRSGAGPLLLSRPISTSTLVAGKWAGVALSMLLLLLSGAVAMLWMSEVAADDHHLNVGSLWTYVACLLGAVAFAGARHYLVGGNFVLSANILVLISVLCVWLVRLFASGAAAFDWSAPQAAALLALAALAFSAFLLPLAASLEAPVVLVTGIVIFALGLVGEYVVGLLADGALATLGRALLPNWQPYWIADRLAAGEILAPAYFMHCVVNSGLLVVVYASVATLLYARREVS
jgi:hypothetical protein